jgi:hypothetical protein
VAIAAAKAGQRPWPPMTSTRCDLSAPGLREDWEAGDHSRHYPYRKADQVHSAAEARLPADRNTTVRSDNSKSFLPNGQWYHLHARGPAIW